ncbi:MAG: transcription repressor NadR [Clostridia bacterium]|nr:transcription repressor NadR [Clostridia bacterium]
MDGNKRRELIMQLLESSGEIINATTFAEKFGVTRQVIVSDVALLRANGKQIRSEKRGYYLERENSGIVKEVIVCKHDSNGLLDELYTVVDNGGKLLNVMVEHPIYGQLVGTLNIASRYDAQEFMENVRKSKAGQLCDLTNGVHYHTISCPNPETYDRIVRALSEKGILQE